MNVSELLTLFKKKPYTVKYSANKLSERFKCTVEDAIKAKRSIDVFMASNNDECADFKRKFFAGEVDFD